MHPYFFSSFSLGAGEVGDVGGDVTTGDSACTAAAAGSSASGDVKPSAFERRLAVCMNEEEVETKLAERGSAC